MKVSKFLFHAFTVFLTFQFISCFKAKRAPYDSSSPQGLIRNLAVRNLKPIPPQPPIIKTFQVSKKNVHFGAAFQITWEVEDPNGDPITCELDLEPDGIIDDTEQNCSKATKNFTLPRTGLFTPTLKVSDGTHQIQSPLEGGPILSELAGELDAGFISNPIPLNYAVVAIQPLPSEKILALDFSFTLSKLHLINEDGSLDHTATFLNDFRALALQKDGKIVAAGISGSNPSSYYIARLLPDLSLDNSFGTGGTISHFLDTSSKDIQAIQIDENGKILLAGFNDSGFVVIRLQPNGNLDISFGLGGMKNFTADTSANYLYGLSILPSGKILVSGSASDGTNGRFVVARLNSDGSLDTSFGTGGIAKKEFTGLGGGRKHVIQKDGKIVVIGYSTSSGNQISTLVRFNENGSIDTSFGTGGVVTTYIPNQTIGFNVHILEDGKILATGIAVDGSSNNYPFAIRYLSNGNLDTSFGLGGKFIDTLQGIPLLPSVLDNKGRLLYSCKDGSYFRLRRLK